MVGSFGLSYLHINSNTRRLILESFHEAFLGLNMNGVKPVFPQCCLSQLCFFSVAKPPRLKAAHPRLHSLYPAKSAPPASLSFSHLCLSPFQHRSPKQPSSTPPSSSQQAPVPTRSRQTRTDHFTGRAIFKKNKNK